MTTLEGEMRQRIFPVCLLVLACAGCATSHDDDMRLQRLEERTAMLERAANHDADRLDALDARVDTTDASVSALGDRIGRLETARRSVPTITSDELATQRARQAKTRTPQTSAPAKPKTAPVEKAAPVVHKTSPSGAATSVAAYRDALTQLERGRTDDARKSFDTFIATYPGDALQPNAHYWRGEALYALGKYGDAIIDFKDVVASYPKHQKAADSLLKAGMAYQRLGDQGNASFQFKALQSEYPASSAAAIARKRGYVK